MALPSLFFAALEKLFECDGTPPVKHSMPIVQSMMNHIGRTVGMPTSIVSLLPEIKHARDKMTSIVIA